MPLPWWQRLADWAYCTYPECCCPNCCDYCRREWEEFVLTPEYAAEKLSALRRFARKALRFMRGLMLVGLALGVGGVFSPAIMNHPSRLGAAALAALSAVGLWNFSLIEDEDNER